MHTNDNQSITGTMSMLSGDHISESKCQDLQISNLTEISCLVSEKMPPPVHKEKPYHRGGHGGSNY